MLTISFRSSLHSPPLPGIIVYLYGKNTAAPLRREKSALMTAKTKENLSVAARVCVALMILLLIILNYDRLTHIDMRALVDLAPNFAAAVFMLLGVYFVKSVLFVIPASLIYVSIGMAFDWPTACLINMGGILLEDPDEENTAADLQLAEAAQQTAQNGTYGTAMLYYAFDDTVNSSRYPNYAYMQSYWTSVGLDTKLDTTVTVADLRRMNNYDLCVLSTHGAYYTYEYGWLWKRTATAPVLLLTEKSTFWNDLRYGMDLLNHRIIKVNGAYAVTAGFFRAAYRSGALKDTIILSETCEFYGKSGHLDTSMADALLSGGAACVAGYVNNVYTVYSRSMLWATVNRLLAGDTVREAVDFGLNLYGADDIIWYNNQGGRRPHAVASFPVLSGNQDARLRAVQAAADSTQQAA